MESRKVGRIYVGFTSIGKNKSRLQGALIFDRRGRLIRMSYKPQNRIFFRISLYNSDSIQAVRLQQVAQKLLKREGLESKIDLFRVVLLDDAAFREINKAVARSSKRISIQNH